MKTKVIILFSMLLLSFIAAIIAWFQWDQNMQSSSRDFTLYDPPYLLDNYVNGKSFLDTDRTDPLSVYSSFFLIENADQLLSLYTEETLNQSINKKVILSGNTWSDSNVKSMPKKIKLLFSYKYSGKYGPPEWYVCYKYMNTPRQKHDVTSVVFQDQRWFYWMSVNDNLAREYIYEEVFKDIYQKDSLTELEIEEYKKKLKEVDSVLEQRERVEKGEGAKLSGDGSVHYRKGTGPMKEKAPTP